jgi:hypothetical protein
VYQTPVAVGMKPHFCPPDPPISRNEGVARLLAWAKQHPNHLEEAPADVVGRFLVEAFPCRESAAGTAKQKK